MHAVTAIAMDIREILARAPVIPVLTVTTLEHAVPLARALVAGGLGVLEVTLRTPCALDAIEAMRAAVPDAIVGVGTLTRPEDFAAGRARRRPVRREPRLRARARRRPRARSAIRCSPAS